MTIQSIYLQVNRKDSDVTDQIKEQSNLKIINDIEGDDHVNLAGLDPLQLLELKRDASHLLYILVPNIDEYNIIPELIDDSNKIAHKTSFFFKESDNGNTFSKHQVKSLKAIGEMVEINGGTWIKNEDQLIDHLLVAPTPKEVTIQKAVKEKSKKRRKKIRIFLGGTVNGSTWRDGMIKQLNVDFFNPVVDEWNDQAYHQELLERKNCDYNLYLITPLMTGYYSLAEVVDDSFKKPGQALYCFLNTEVDHAFDANKGNHVIPGDPSKGEKFTQNQIRSLRTIGRYVENNGGIWCKSPNEVITFFNKVDERSDYYNTYTTFLERAVKWNHTHKDPDLLLKGFNLVDATSWIQGSDQSDVLPPTQLIRDYHEASLNESSRSTRNSAFISYSRTDSLSYAHELYDQLTDNNLNIWFDKKRIRTGVDFNDEIQIGIEKAGSFIFLISPRSCASPYCLEELKMALSYGKRIIPVLHKTVGDDDVMMEIRYFHREEFDQKLLEDAGEQSRILDGILNSISSGENLVLEHTQLLSKALDWDRAGRPEKLLLKSTEQVNAHNWLIQCNESDVPFDPSSIHCDFICESKRRADNDFSDFWLCTHKMDRHSKTIQFILQRHGFKTWWQEKENEINIEERIVKASRVIFIITPASLNDKKCLAEIEIARAYDIPIIPLLAEYIEINELFSDKEKELLKDFSLSENSSDLFKENIESWVKSDLLDEKSYYSKLKYIKHKYFQWSTSENKQPFLIRGEALKEYKNWLKTYQLENYVTYDKISEYLNSCNGESAIDDIEVYLSYHEEMEHFAFRLNEQLNDSGKVTWNDQTDRGASASKSSDYHVKGINSSDNIVIIASDKYFNSDETLNELKVIQSTGKRTILVTETGQTNGPDHFRPYSIVDFSENFELASTQLLNELNTDHQYVKKYNYYLGLARTWDNEGKKTSKLLPEADEAKIAASWLYDSKQKSPKPTDLLILFIDSSVKEQERKKKQAVLKNRLLVFITILAIIATIYSVKNQFDADESALIALEETANAKEAKIEAEKAQEKAEQSKRDAEESRKIAEENAEKAITNGRIAADKAEEAVKARKEAVKSRITAENSRKEAVDAKNEAEDAKNEAEDAKNEAEKSAMISQFLQTIEKGKALALAVPKLLISDADSARKAAIASFEILSPYFTDEKKDTINSSTKPLLFDALSYVSEYSDSLQHHILHTTQELVDFQIDGSRVLTLSENGELSITDLKSEQTWSTSSRLFHNASCFAVVGNNIVVGNRYGQIHDLTYELSNDKDTLFTIYNSSLQVHEKNTNISKLAPISIGNENAWVSVGFDGTMNISARVSNQLKKITSFEQQPSDKILSLSIGKSQSKIAFGTQNSGIYLIELINSGPIEETRVFLSRSIVNDIGVTAIQLNEANGIVMLGLENGALKEWNLARNEILNIDQIKEHKLAITSIATDANILITGSRDGSAKIRFWKDDDLTAPPTVYTYSQHRSSAEVLQVHFDDVQGQIISLDRNELRRWNIDINHLHKKVKQGT